MDLKKQFKGLLSMKKLAKGFNLRPYESIHWKGRCAEDAKEGEFSLGQGIGLITYLVEKIVYVFGLIGLTYMFYIDLIDFKEYIIFPLFAFLYVLFVWCSDYVDVKAIEEIEYIITNKRVVFRSWSLLKGIKYDELQLVNIQKLSLEEFGEGKGTIYFMGSKIGNFKNSEHYPALLYINDAKELMPDIQNLIQVAKRNDNS